MTDQNQTNSNNTEDKTIDSTPTQQQTSDQQFPGNQNTRLEDVIGYISMVDKVPTSRPLNFYGQFKLYVNGSDKRFYAYNFETASWDFTPLNGNIGSVEKTVQATGLAVGDLVSYVPGYSSGLLYRTYSVNGFTSQINIGTTNSQKASFKFKCPMNTTLKKITLELSKQGTPTDNVKLSIRLNSETGTLVDSLTVSTPNGDTDFTFNTALQGGITYYCVLERTGTLSNIDYWKLSANHFVDADQFHPDSLGTKIVNGLGAWVDYSTSGYDSIVKMAVYGDITSGYKKWYGCRTNILHDPFLGIVKSVLGTDVTFVISGYISGLVGLTAGELIIIGGIVVGKAISATEAIIFEKKYGLLNSLHIYRSLSYSLDFNLPLGWKPTAYELSPITSFTDGSEAEILVSSTSNGTELALGISNEYSKLITT